MNDITLNKKDLASKQEVVQKYTIHFGSKTLVLQYVEEKITTVWVQNGDKLKEKNIPIVVHSPMYLPINPYVIEYINKSS